MKRIIAILVTTALLVFGFTGTAQAKEYYAPSKTINNFQRDISAGTPSACKRTKIEYLDLRNQKRGFRDMLGLTYQYKRQIWFEFYVDGKVNPRGKMARTLFKHECGHVLYLKAIQKKSNKKVKALLKSDRTWKKRNYGMVEENLADCIADRLNGKRYNTRNTRSYTVGYGTRCSVKQYRIADTIIKWGK